MSGYTPGPWHVAPESKAQSPWIVCDSEGGSIADCEPPGPWMSRETADANARLIAAAPDMLAALKNLATTEAEELLSGCSDVRAQVVAAIAKATGEPK